MPAEAHSAGSSKRLAEAADVDVDNDAEDGAIPRVTSLPSATAHTCGRVGFGGAHTAAEPYRTMGEPCGERNSILPVELGCGNEQLGSATVIWRRVSYILTP
jgi:hypothetical protein